jgi:hypothetical protein
MGLSARRKNLPSRLRSGACAIAVLGVFEACGADESPPAAPAGGGGADASSTGGTRATGGARAPGGAAPTTGGSRSAGGTDASLAGGAPSTGGTGGRAAGGIGGAGGAGGTPLDASPDAVVDASTDVASPPADASESGPFIGPLLQRMPGFPSLAPPIGAPLPTADAGSWTYVAVDGAICRDGSPAGFFYKPSATSPNLMIFMEGGGVCFDVFCTLNPANVNERVTGETIADAVANQPNGTPQQVPQTPPPGGIFSNDPRNPAADWNMVYIPYCTGDVFAGTRRGADAGSYGIQQFVGYENTTLFFSRIIPTFPKPDAVILTGSSAGGFGALFNAQKLADGYLDFRGPGARMRFIAVSDSGPTFDDPYLGACLQKQWRDLWGLDAALPQDCAGCFNADGGGLARGLAAYYRSKYSDSILGGLISSEDDEIISLFYAPGLNDCPSDANSYQYTPGLYHTALDDLRDSVMGTTRFNTYFIAGSKHMHVFRDRYYEDNGVGMTIAEFMSRTLAGVSVNVEGIGLDGGG